MKTRKIIIAGALIIGLCYLITACGGNTPMPCTEPATDLKTSQTERSPSPEISFQSMEVSGFSGVLGFDGELLTHENSAGYSTSVYYANAKDGQYAIARKVTQGLDFPIYQIDIDGDGSEDAVFNNQSGYGYMWVEVYKRNGCDILRSYIKLSEEIVNAHWYWGPQAISTAYNPESGEIDVNYYNIYFLPIDKASVALKDLSFDWEVFNTLPEE